MAVAIVKEDGTGVANANSYVSVQDFRDYCTLRGTSALLPTTDDAVGSLLIRAMDYIGTYSDQFVGYVSYAGQPLDWPRSGIVDDTGRNPRYEPAPLPESYMPPKLLQCQFLAALAILSLGDLQPAVGTQGFVSSEKVGPIQTDYIRPSDYSTSPRIPAFDAAMATLIERDRPLLSVSRG